MIKITKNLAKIPKVLQSNNRQEAFLNNIKEQRFCYGLKLYQTKDIKKELQNIYYNKCAYCEKNISDDPQNIEHYRPKNIYYWLAYSWDNLLLCCSKCNSSKKDKFDTKKPKVKYNNEEYKNIHTLGLKYDNIEEPMFINPEREDILDDILFNPDGTIYSNNKRVQYTIDNCNLNRTTLVQNRVSVLNDFKKLFELYLSLAKLKNDISLLKPILNDFKSKCKKEYEYYAFRKYIVDNLRLVLKG